MSKKADRDKVKSYDSLVDSINSMGYNVSSDIETSILDELKRLRECKEKYEWLVRKIEEEEEDAESIYSSYSQERFTVNSIEAEGYLRCAKTINNIVTYIESHYD